MKIQHEIVKRDKGHRTGYNKRQIMSVIKRAK